MSDNRPKMSIFLSIVRISHNSKITFKPHTLVLMGWDGESPHQIWQNWVPTSSLLFAVPLPSPIFHFHYFDYLEGFSQVPIPKRIRICLFEGSP